MAEKIRVGVEEWRCELKVPVGTAICGEKFSNVPDFLKHLEERHSVTRDMVEFSMREIYLKEPTDRTKAKELSGIASKEEETVVEERSPGG